MPIEIKELEINTTLTGESHDAGLIDSQQKQAIVSECIEKIMKILNDKQEF